MYFREALLIFKRVLRLGFIILAVALGGSTRLDMKTKCRFTVIAAAILLVCVTAANSFSQSQISSGDIKGTATDATGAVLPGATVTLTNIETGVER